MNAHAMKSGVVDKVVWFFAPILIGGKDAKNALGGGGIDKLSGAPRLKNTTVISIGEDLMLEGYL